MDLTERPRDTTCSHDPALFDHKWSNIHRVSFGKIWNKKPEKRSTGKTLLNSDQVSSRLIFSDADSHVCWLPNVELVLIPGLQKNNAKLYSGYWTAAAFRYLTDCLWGLNLTKQPLKKSLQTLHVVHVTLCFSLKLEQLYNVWRADTSLLILQAMWGTAGVFMCCAPHWGFQPVRGFLQPDS